MKSRRTAESAFDHCPFRPRPTSSSFAMPVMPKGRAELRCHQTGLHGDDSPSHDPGTCSVTFSPTGLGGSRSLPGLAKLVTSQVLEAWASPEPGTGRHPLTAASATCRPRMFLLQLSWNLPLMLRKSPRTRPTVVASDSHGTNP